MTNKKRKVFIISDTHFGHKNILGFKDNYGEKLRDFDNVEHMDTHMIYRWNTVVHDNDLVLHLGDVCFSGQTFDKIMPLLNGEKYLIRGNHDTLSESRYNKWFKRILGCYVRDNFVFTHIPIHPDSVERWKGNIHGHLHSNIVDDRKYFNASVEQLDYNPIDFEDIKEIFKESQVHEKI